MVRLELIKNSEVDYIEALYENSFPKEERKSFSGMLELSKCNKTLPLVIHDEAGKAVGMCFFMLNADIALLDYLAVDKSYRNMGLGEEALKRVAELFPEKRIILEIETVDREADNYEIRVRRKNFYIRNGLIPTNIISRLFTCRYQVLTFGEMELSFDEYADVYYGVFGNEKIKGNIEEVSPKESEQL